MSLGQAQRVLIALSLLHGPKLLLADEPTSALDVVTQRELLELLAELSRERGMATLFISHDLLSVAAFCQRVAILDAGTIIEQGTVEAVFESPRHPYARKLVGALRRLPGMGRRPEEAGAGALLALDSAVAQDAAAAAGDAMEPPLKIPG